jgi:hypothetical protein
MRLFLPSACRFLRGRSTKAAPKYDKRAGMARCQPDRRTVLRGPTASVICRASLPVIHRGRGDRRVAQVVTHAREHVTLGQRLRILTRRAATHPATGTRCFRLVTSRSTSCTSFPIHMGIDRFCLPSVRHWRAQRGVRPSP